MLVHTILINRPIAVTPLGTKLCRPSEVVLDILPDPQLGAFTKEDGEPVGMPKESTLGKLIQHCEYATDGSVRNSVSRIRDVIGSHGFQHRTTKFFRLLESFI